MLSVGSVAAALGGAVLGVGAGVAALILTTAQPARSVDAGFGGGAQAPVVAATATPSASPAAVQAGSGP
jgi:hypothetical protein